MATDKAIDPLYASALLRLEVNVAMRLMRRASLAESLVDTGTPVRGGLILQAAHTVLPEANLQSLPGIAREEIMAGLEGPIRRQIAAEQEEIRGTEKIFAHRQDARLSDLAGSILVELDGSADAKAALRIATHIHLARGVRQVIPIVVAASCLAWYQSYEPSGGSSAREVHQAAFLVERWVDLSPQCGAIELEMSKLAQGLVGDDPADLLDFDI